MKVIKNLSLVNELNLPEQVKTALHSELTDPFDGCLNTTADFWHEYDTFLILLEESDVDSSLLDADEDMQYFIQYVTDNPEFVVLLNDDTCPYLLALSVTTTVGGGCYLLAPLTSNTNAVTALSKLI
ncbi:hypothetical protein [Moritella viscosa]|uniref:Uncharacterized protein n=1 Tax=Moritella viscosa TaxID=80854 RepID=A0ABY1HG39_9GAMM|nr:hypothetical protein [Moritella viscosa]SGY91322.1 Putative uncharacterized protein [Moritella viscosa]SGZ17255.1 Putative uncharacterized protein [Moritella viscosa]SHO26219.1 Putative uncharacterized protein [Moritella viscosa]